MSVLYISKDFDYNDLTEGHQKDKSTSAIWHKIGIHDT